MSKLTILSRERDFIAGVGLCADRSVVSLATFLRVPVHQLHYTINKLTERDIVKKVWVIDTFLLGLTRYNIFFSLGGGEKKKRDQIIKDLASSVRTVFIAEVGGDFDYELSILARTASEVGEFIRGFSHLYGNVFRVRVISTRLSMVHFPRKYLSKRAPLCSNLSIGDRPGNVTIDQFDSDILTALSSNPNSSIRDVARRIGRPESSVDLRMKRLVKEGVVRGALWSTNASRYGAQTFRLLIQTRGLSTERREDVLAFASSHPQVTSLVEGFGQWDIEMVAEVSDYRQLSMLRESLYHHFSDIILDIRLLNRFVVHRYRSFSSV